MIVQRAISEPVRPSPTFDERWNGPDGGLIACWECGREKSVERPEQAQCALQGELPMLPWKGGVDKPTKALKVGTHFYLAMYQGLRGEDLCIDTSAEPVLTCTKWGTSVVYTGIYEKFANAE